LTATDPATNGHEAAGKLDAFKADFKAGKPPYNLRLRFTLLWNAPRAS